MKPKFHSLTIADVRKETEDTVSVAFQIPEALTEVFSFLPGQYLTLKAMIGGEDIRRSYSLCSAPFENEWRVAIKQVAGGKFSTYANTELKPGMELEVMNPMGNFLVETQPEQDKSYVLFASGSGITPILSIAKAILHDEPQSDITLFYGNKGFASIIFREELEALKNTYMDRLRIVHILSRESLGNDIQKGRITEEKAHQLYDAFLAQTTVDGAYICGPEEMILSVKEALMKKGIEESRIHFELFTSSNAKKNAIELPTQSPKIDSNVTIVIDGEEYDLALSSNGQSILDAAQEAGADVPFACKGGVCCTCKAKIMEGSVSMDVNYALEKDEVEAGYILTCQSHPTSDKLIISFDE